VVVPVYAHDPLLDQRTQCLGSVIADRGRGGRAVRARAIVETGMHPGGLPTVARMAKLETLIASVADAELRAQIEAEVAVLNDRSRFGLVYERHLPETVIVGTATKISVSSR